MWSKQQNLDYTFLMCSIDQGFKKYLIDISLCHAHKCLHSRDHLIHLDLSVVGADYLFLDVF